jgi:hypothetical protein
MDGNSSKNANGLDYNVIKAELNSVFESTANKIEREWPETYAVVDSARELFLLTIRIAINTYNTIVYICADKPEDYRRDRRFSLSVPPLNRTLLETTIMLLLVIEDIPRYTVWFYKSGWLEWKEAYDRYKRDYGNLPEWEDFITKLSYYVDSPPSFLHLSQEETRDPIRNIGYWPNTPGKILKRFQKDHSDSLSISFINYLNDWFYRELSGQTHLNMHGLLERGMYFSKDTFVSLFGDEAEAKMQQEFDKFRNDQIWVAITLMLSMMSEIEAHFHFGLDQKLKYLWGIAASYSGKAKEIYNRRYSNALG